MKLSDLKAGEQGTIRGFEASDLELKLMEMGCIPGEKVIVEKVAPLGDPISIRIAGYSLSLRKMRRTKFFLKSNLSFVQMKIGLYFGSFNPIHVGHLIIASHILNETDIEKVWFVVSPHNPFKESASLLNEYDRLYLVNKAIERDDRLRASDIEFSLPKPSYTAHTLTYLSEKYPDHDFTIIMGSDSFQNLNKWKNAEAIIANYPLLVYLRPQFEFHNTIGAQATMLEAPLLEISSTYIRQCIGKGKSIKYLVPDSVREEIEKSSFYKKTHKK